jgi:hypothetical protein
MTMIYPAHTRAISLPMLNVVLAMNGKDSRNRMENRRRYLIEVSNHMLFERIVN